MKTFYKVNVRSVLDEQGNPNVVYGIDAVSADNIVQASIVDAFDSCDKATTLAKMCTELNLAPEHLQDVVEDTL